MKHAKDSVSSQVGGGGFAQLPRSAAIRRAGRLRMGCFYGVGAVTSPVETHRRSPLAAVERCTGGIAPPRSVGARVTVIAIGAPAASTGARTAALVEVSDVGDRARVAKDAEAGSTATATATAAMASATAVAAIAACAAVCGAPAPGAAEAAILAGAAGTSGSALAADAASERDGARLDGCADAEDAEGLRALTPIISEFNSMVWKLKKDSGLSLKSPISEIVVPHDLSALQDSLIRMHSIE